MPKRALSFLTLLILLLPVLAACGGTPTPAAPTAAPAAGATAAPAAGGRSDAVMTIGGAVGSAFQRNFNPFSPNSLVGTVNSAYEPLMILNSITGEVVPWLATRYEFSADNQTLTFTIRDGVKWSDGQPLSARDVAFTFNLLKNTPGLNSTVLSALSGPTAYIDSITAPDDSTVVFTFSRVYTPGVYELFVQNIVPEHIWKNVSDPAKFTNDNPVGSGPFTEVTNFQTQSYELHRNPNYWQESKPAIKGIRFLAFPDRNAESLAAVNGEIDWSNTSISDPDQTFVARDPTNRYYISESGPNMACLALNIAKEPFDDVNVRKAISMAINREQISVVGENGVSPPADVTGLGPFYQAWKVADPASLGDWTTYNPDKANQLLDAAGLAKGGDGIRVLPDGTPMKYTIPVLPLPNWLADMQIIADNLRAVGIEVSPEPVQFPQWQEAQQKGTYDMMFNIVDGNATPYRFYYNTMSSALLEPVGTQAFGNSTRYAGKKADDLLNQFASTADPARQKEIIQQVQRVFAEEVPTLPLFPLSGTGFINTAHFTGFPTREDHYASAQYNPFFADQLIVFTRVQPK